MAAITSAQIGCMYALAKQLNMDRDDLHTYAGVGSLKDLSLQRAIMLIDGLKEMAGQEPNTTRRGKPTPKQLNMINSLAKQLGWDDERLRLFIEKRFRISHLRFLDDKTAPKVIEAMKAMLKGGRGERRKTDDTDTAVVARTRPGAPAGTA